MKKCDTFSKFVIFICMKKNKQLRIRITEEQYRKLCDELSGTTQTKSVIVRQIIDGYKPNKNE
jgi:predicted DNA-binding protein